jgi:hypothetical protein
LHKLSALLITKHKSDDAVRVRSEDIEKSLVHVEFAQQCFKEAGCTSGIAGCLFYLGTLRNTKREYANARQKLKEALRLYEHLDHTVAKMITYELLNRIARSLNLTKEIVEYSDLVKSKPGDAKHKRVGRFLIHKGGKYVERTDGRRISLMIEPAFVIDSQNPRDIRKNDLFGKRDGEVKAGWKSSKLRGDWEKLNASRSGRVMDLMPAMKM